MSGRCAKAVIVASVWLMWVSHAIGGQSNGLAEGVRGLATHAPAGMTIDGNLANFKDAFATSVGYFRGALKNRVAQFFYIWDDEAFYAGLRTLDGNKQTWRPTIVFWKATR